MIISHMKKNPNQHVQLTRLDKKEDPIIWDLQEIHVKYKSRLKEDSGFPGKELEADTLP